MTKVKKWVQANTIFTLLFLIIIITLISPVYAKTEETPLLYQIVDNANKFGSKTLSKGETWDLGNGITITVESLDIPAKQAWLTLSDYGVKLEDKIVEKGDVYHYNTIFLTTVTNIWDDSTGGKILLTDTSSSRPVSKTGSISISSTPSNAEVHLDGIYMGITPITFSEIPVGSHKIDIVKIVYDDITGAIIENYHRPETITILSGKEIQVSYELPIVEDEPIAGEETLPAGWEPPVARPFYETQDFIVMSGFGLFIVIISIIALKRKRTLPNKSETIKSEIFASQELKKSVIKFDEEETLPKHKSSALPDTLGESVQIKTAFGYKGAAIIYKLKIENNTSDPISDIKVYPYVPDVFLLKEKDKSISLIEPNSSQTVTFEIRPTGECGDCNVSGRVNYYDMASRKRQDIELEPKSLSIVCPMLRGKEINEDEWHDAVGNLVKTEESTREIDMPAESLFTMVSRIVKDMHMYMQKPEITDKQQLFNGVARFYAEGVKGLKYAAHVEVMGGAKKSKLILKVWAEKEDALTGFYHGVLDEIEKRVNVKEYIQDSIVQQYNIHYGDKIGTQVKDSVVQRSNFGDSV